MYSFSNFRGIGLDSEFEMASQVADRILELELFEMVFIISHNCVNSWKRYEQNGWMFIYPLSPPILQVPGLAGPASLASDGSFDFHLAQLPSWLLNDPTHGDVDTGMMCGG